MFSIFGKIKTWIIAALAMAVPIIYVMGRIKGATQEKNRVLKDDLEAAKTATEFYKSMAEHETDTLTDRNTITDRLRSNGLQDPSRDILPDN